MNEQLNKLFEENVRNNLKAKNYQECINLLKNKINDLFSYRISKHIDDFRYTCLEDLLDIGAPVLTPEEALILNQYYLTVRKDSAYEFKVYKLLDIYKKIK